MHIHYWQSRENALNDYTIIIINIWKVGNVVELVFEEVLSILS